ncbi:MAG TPA: hypothetical protein DDW65_13625 [Firmicutes bacterium]|nr:hypothetical protein [Bacillota bacterium]
MRPVPVIIKTALIFYLVYAVLISAVTLWPGHFRPAFTLRESTQTSVVKDGNRDLSIRQAQYKKAWQQILVDEGYIPQAVFKSRIEKLNEQRAGLDKVQWIDTESIILLPMAVTQNHLIRLTSKWQELTQTSGFEVKSASWGITKGQLWVKLSSTVQVKLNKHSVNLPLEQLTMIQPVKRLRGNIPGLVPAFPPRPEPAKVKEEAEAEAKPKPKAPEIHGSQPLGMPETKKTNPIKPVFIKKKARVAIIIDDVGYVTGPTDAMLKVSAPLTFSVLPFGPYSQKYAAAAKERGFEIMLHLPLEPLNPKVNPGPGVIKRSFTEEEVDEELGKDLEQVPEAIGVNNHEGSAGTSDDRLMGILMAALKKRQMFFVDSMTVASSVALKYARLNNLPSAKRKIFIDNQTDLASKKQALRELIKIALRDGTAIAIGHVRDNTAQAITEMLPEFVKAGIEVVPVSQLVK